MSKRDNHVFQGLICLETSHERGHELMKEVLLIGENGFLGKELKSELIKEKRYKLTSTSRNVSSDLFFDLNKNHNLKLEKYSVVILLAAITNIRQCEDNVELCFATNVNSTINFIDEAVSNGCFVVFLSSNSVFDGKKQFYSINEVHSPITKYGVSKSIVEKWIVNKHPNKVAILRLTKVLPEKGCAPFVQKWLDDVASEGTSKVFTNHYISPISTGDVASAIKKLIEFGSGGVFQKGADVEFSYLEYATYVLREMPEVLAKLKASRQGERNFYNSLKTFLPESKH